MTQDTTKHKEIINLLETFIANHGVDYSDPKFAQCACCGSITYHKEGCIVVNCQNGYYSKQIEKLEAVTAKEKIRSRVEARRSEILAKNQAGGSLVEDLSKLFPDLTPEMVEKCLSDE